MLNTSIPAEAPAKPDHSDAIGPVTIAGNEHMEPLIRQLCTSFSQTHRQAEFRLAMKGVSPAIPALATDACRIAVMSRAPRAADRAAFKSAKGYPASSLRIGYMGHGPRPGGRTPPALYVHASNPLKSLSMGDVARIFSSGSPQGDLNVWDQLGLDGEWTGRRIHLYGLRDDGRYASGFRETHMAGRAYAVHYEALPDKKAVANAVALDPFGIGSIGWLGDEWNGRDIRIVPLSKEPKENASTPNLDDISRGRYPLTPCLSLYFDRAPAEPLPNPIRNFLEFALSDGAQDVMAGFTEGTAGYVPLSQADRLEERDKLARL